MNGEERKEIFITPCKSDSDCVIPKALVEFRSDYNKYNIKAEIDREKYRKKQDYMCGVIEDIAKSSKKVDLTLHGNKEAGVEGLVDRFIKVEKLSYILTFIHGWWSSVKKPVLILITVGLIAMFIYFLKMYWSK